MRPLNDADDYLHEPPDHPNWRESWYFNWVDLKTNISGFSTIGLLPNQPKREFVFALFIDGTPEFYFNELKEPISEDFNAALRDAKLGYELITPHTDWRIHYESPRLLAEIQWESRFPPGDFGKASGTSWVRHLEQSGRIKGYIEYPDGQTEHFTGLGQRDKSWGIRDWHIDEWFALHAQFDELMIGLRFDRVKGKNYPAGIISNEEGNVPIVKISVNTEFEEDLVKKPIKALTQITDSKNRTFTLSSEPLHSNAFARYSRQFEGGETELFEFMVIHECEELSQTGTGLAEWLFTHKK